MFAAASGARLAHRHNKIKKQICATEFGGYEAQYNHHIKYPDIHGNRFAGLPHRRPNNTSKIYYDSNPKLSSSYNDINGGITKLEFVDFESKAAWQDRELNHESGLKGPIVVCNRNEVAISCRTKQNEAHRRWVKRNRIHDLSFGDCSSNEKLIYGVQNGAANLLLYVGLGTMCIGMIITFVGTGEKGFKTMELKLIGPCLIGTGVLIIILRVMLCFCPSKCSKLKKHKHKLKNSTNKLNSEGNRVNENISSSKESLNDDSKKNTEGKPQEGKKRVSIPMLPNSSGDLKSPKTTTCLKSNSSPAVSVLFMQDEKSRKLNETQPKEATNEKTSNLLADEEDEDGLIIEMNSFGNRDGDMMSFGSDNSSGENSQPFPEPMTSPESSDISLISLVHSSPLKEQNKKISKFEAKRDCKNLPKVEIVLSPFSLKGK